VTHVWVVELYINGKCGVLNDLCILAEELGFHGFAVRVTESSVRVRVVALDEGRMYSFIDAVNVKYGEYISRGPSDAEFPDAPVWTNDIEAVALARKPFYSMATRTDFKSLAHVAHLSQYNTIRTMT